MSIIFENVTKSFKGSNGLFTAIDEVNLTIQSNELFGIIGESGAGKSTLLRFINALESPEQGRVLVDGVDVTSLNRKQLRQHQKDIGMIFQQFNLLENKNVRDNILLPLKLHHYEQSLDIHQVLEFVGLSDKQFHYPSQLSGGQKQRVGIARALITRPKILLCDEPTSALDQNTKEGIVDVLRRAHQEFGMTIVVVTHELDVIKELCDYSAILDQGKLLDVIKVTSSYRSNKEFRPYYDRALEVLTNDG